MNRTSWLALIGAPALLLAGLSLSRAGSSGSKDTFLPWEGGAEYYKKWANGPRSDPGYFPISVWHQSPSNAARYKAIGVNQYIGPWSRRPGESIEVLTKTGMPLIASQTKNFLASQDKATIRGWFLFDEPDNAQEKPGGGWGSCILPPKMLEQYKQYQTADPTRPAFLNFGQAVVHEEWPGRGDFCTGHYEHYAQYIEGADIISYDVYPVNEKLPLWWVGRGIDRLRAWAQYRKPVWNWIETSSYNGGPKPSPSDVVSETWMSIIHGSMGVGYFCHQFKPTSNEAAPLDDPPMREALTALNARIAELAPVLNTRSVGNGVTVRSSRPESPVEYMLKRQGGATYLFAMGARPGGSVKATFKLRDCPSNIAATVIGESRTINLKSGVMEDQFDNYQVHLYRIPFVPKGAK